MGCALLFVTELQVSIYFTNRDFLIFIMIVPLMRSLSRLKRRRNCIVRSPKLIHFTAGKMNFDFDIKTTFFKSFEVHNPTIRNHLFEAREKCPFIRQFHLFS